MIFTLCIKRIISCFFFFFFNDTATTEIYTLSLHDALPISTLMNILGCLDRPSEGSYHFQGQDVARSEEHTSELQSPCNLVCRLLLEKKKKHHNNHQDKNSPTTRTHRIVPAATADRRHQYLA